MSASDRVRILAISGSVRRASSNSALVDAAAQLVPVGAEIAVYRELAQLPPFDPDINDEAAPETVARLRFNLQESDAVLIASPEYAHGVPGVLKNALDWLVGSGELVDKPVALVNASAHATHAWASLVETLTVMSARVVREASLTIPVQGRKLDARGIANDAELSQLLGAAIAHLVEAARSPRSG